MTDEPKLSAASRNAAASSDVCVCGLKRIPVRGQQTSAVTVAGRTRSGAQGVQRVFFVHIILEMYFQYHSRVLSISK